MTDKIEKEDEVPLRLNMCGPSTLPCKCQCPTGPCDHKWDGPWVGDDQVQSSTCSKCGMVCMDHDMWVGP